MQHIIKWLHRHVFKRTDFVKRSPFGFSIRLVCTDFHRKNVDNSLHRLLYSSKYSEFSCDKCCINCESCIISSEMMFELKLKSNGIHLFLDKLRSDTNTKSKDSDSNLTDLG